MAPAGAAKNPGTWRKTHRADATIVKTADRMQTWHDASRGLPEDRRANIEAMSIAIYPNGFTLFAGNTDGAVFASDDGARRWTQLAGGLAPVSKVGHYRHLVGAGV